MLKFAGKLVNNIGNAGLEMASPYLTPTVSAFTGNKKRAMLQALGLTAGTAVPAGIAYNLGSRSAQMPEAAQAAFTPATDPQGLNFLTNRLASDIQQASPTMTVNEAYYEAEKLVADALQKEFETNNALIDRGADQGDMWSKIVLDPKSKYGVSLMPNKYPKPETGYVYDRQTTKLVPSPWAS